MELSLSAAILWLLIVLAGYAMLFGARGKLIKGMVVGIIIFSFILSYL